MYVNVVVTVILFSVQRIYGHFGPSNELDSRTHVNREELVDFIRSLNEDENQLNMLASNNLGSPDPIGEDKKEQKLKEILRLLKKNYDAYKHHEYVEKNPMHSGARLYLIKNPEVLDEYKSYLQKKEQVASASSDDLSAQEVKLKSIKDMLQALRRNSRVARLKTGRIKDDASDDNFAREPNIDKVMDKNTDMDWEKVGIKKDSGSRENKRFKNKYNNDWTEEKPVKYPKYQNDWDVKRDSYKKYESSDREQWDKNQGSRDYKKSIESPRIQNWDSYGGGREKGRGLGRQRERGYPQGRTPIPVVRNRGIYENE